MNDNWQMTSKTTCRSLSSKLLETQVNNHWPNAEKCLDLTIQLLDVIRQQMRVFTECQAHLRCPRATQTRQCPSNYLDDNLDKLEREYPDIIRRIFRSFPKCCMELRKLSPRPFASKFTLESEYFVRFQFACVQIFIAWTDFELEDSANGGVRDLTQRHSKDFKKYVRQISNFQKEFLEKDFLQHIDHYRTHKFYLDFTDGHLLPSLLMKRYYEVSWIFFYLQIFHTLISKNISNLTLENRTRPVYGGEHNGTEPSNDYSEHNFEQNAED